MHTKTCLKVTLSKLQKNPFKSKVIVIVCQHKHIVPSCTVKNEFACRLTDEQICVLVDWQTKFRGEKIKFKIPT